jgi:hypothetical protein
VQQRLLDFVCTRKGKKLRHFCVNSLSLSPPPHSHARSLSLSPFWHTFHLWIFSAKRKMTLPVTQHFWAHDGPSRATPPSPRLPTRETYTSQVNIGRKSTTVKCQVILNTTLWLHKRFRGEEERERERERFVLNTLKQNWCGKMVLFPIHADIFIDSSLW